MAIGEKLEKLIELRHTNVNKVAAVYCCCDYFRCSPFCLSLDD